MKRSLIVSLIVLKILINADFFPVYLNNNMFINDYFSDLRVKYHPFDNTNLFISENYLIMNESIVRGDPNILFFKQTYSNSQKNNFYLNINLLSGRLFDYDDFKNKSVNILYAFNIRNILDLGFEGFWAENRNDIPKLNQVIAIYNLVTSITANPFLFTFKWGFDPELAYKNTIFCYLNFKPFDNMEMNLFYGNQFDFTGIEGYIEKIEHNDDIFRFAGNIMLNLQKKLNLIYYFHYNALESFQMEFTLGVLDMISFQFYWSNVKEIKRLFFKLPFLGRYGIIFGPEFYRDYYFTIIAREESSKYLLNIGIKSKITFPIKENFSVFVKFTYFI